MNENQKEKEKLKKNLGLILIVKSARNVVS